MKKNKTIITLLLLLSVVTLGIGYAAITQTLKINGTATTRESASAFDVHFLNASPDLTQITPSSENNQKEVSSTASVTTNNKIAQMSVTLTDIGDSQTCTFTVENTSLDGIQAIIKPNNVKITSDSAGQNEFTSEYFTITTNISSDIAIPSTAGNNTDTFTVTVTLKKPYIDTSTEQNEPTHTENFYIILDSISSR